MKYTFKVQLSLDGTWSWGVFDGDSVKGFGCGDGTKFEAIESICKWLSSDLGHPAEEECVCGSKKLYRPFTPGHGHWCPLSEYNLKVVRS